MSRHILPPLSFRSAIRDACRSLVEVGAVVVDLDTTGVDQIDEVICMTVVDLDGKTLLHERCKPMVRVSYGAQKTHGIRGRDLASKPGFEELYPVARRVLDGRRVMTFGSAFDHRIFSQTCRRYGLQAPALKWHCIKRAWAMYHGTQRIKLTTACDRVGYRCPIPGPGSLGEAMRAAALVRYLASQPLQMPITAQAGAVA